MVFVLPCRVARVSDQGRRCRRRRSQPRSRRRWGRPSTGRSHRRRRQGTLSTVTGMRRHWRVSALFKFSSTQCGNVAHTAAGARSAGDRADRARIAQAVADGGGARGRRAGAGRAGDAGRRQLLATVRAVGAERASCERMHKASRERGATHARAGGEHFASGCKQGQGWALRGRRGLNATTDRCS